jgi:hypothetical protein
VEFDNPIEERHLTDAVEPVLHSNATVAKGLDDKEINTPSII